MSNLINHANVDSTMSGDGGGAGDGRRANVPIKQWVGALLATLLLAVVLPGAAIAQVIGIPQPPVPPPNPAPPPPTKEVDPINVSGINFSAVMTPANPTPSDAVTVTISGFTPRACWSLPAAPVVTQAEGELNVDLRLTGSGGNFCAAVITPFNYSVSLGVVAAGTGPIRARLFVNNLLEQRLELVAGIGNGLETVVGHVREVIGGVSGVQRVIEIDVGAVATTPALPHHPAWYRYLRGFWSGTRFDPGAPGIPTGNDCQGLDWDPVVQSSRDVFTDRQCIVSRNTTANDNCSRHFAHHFRRPIDIHWIPSVSTLGTSYTHQVTGESLSMGFEINVAERIVVVEARGVCTEAAYWRTVFAGEVTPDGWGIVPWKDTGPRGGFVFLVPKGTLDSIAVSPCEPGVAGCPTPLVDGGTPTVFDPPFSEQGCEFIDAQRCQDELDALLTLLELLEAFGVRVSDAVEDRAKELLDSGAVDVDALEQEFADGGLTPDLLPLLVVLDPDALGLTDEERLRQLEELGVVLDAEYERQHEADVRRQFDELLDEVNRLLGLFNRRDADDRLSRVLAAMRVHELQLNEIRLQTLSSAASRPPVGGGGGRALLIQIGLIFTIDAIQVNISRHELLDRIEADMAALNLPIPIPDPQFGDEVNRETQAIRSGQMALRVTELLAQGLSPREALQNAFTTVF